MSELTGRIIATLPDKGSGEENALWTDGERIICNKDSADSLLKDFNTLCQMMTTMSVLAVRESFPGNKDLSCIRLLQGKEPCRSLVGGGT